MSHQTTSGFAPVGQTQLYYEIAGAGQPLVMLHAGVADHRQWNNEFMHFAQRMRVVRYDQRGFGQSLPAEEEFSPLADLTALLAHLQLNEPLILMGCSMGGSLAMDFALSYPDRVKALIMVDSAPSGLDLDVEELAKFAEVERASKAGDLDLTAELETQIWFDGERRTPSQVNQTMRALAYEMNRRALELQAQDKGTRLPNSATTGAERLPELNIPMLVIVGAEDEPYTLAAADYMVQHLPFARKVVIQDAAHLPNMEHPEEFQRVVWEFLDELGV